MIKTIEIRTGSIEKSIDLVRKIYNKDIESDQTFWFLFEPDVVIRTASKKTEEHIISTIKNNYSFEYEVYSYPKTVKGRYKDYKNGVIWRHRKHILPMFNLFSTLILSRKKRDRDRITERIVHVYFNMQGYSWIEECEHLLALAIGRVRVEIRHGDISALRKAYLYVVKGGLYIIVNLTHFYNSRD